MWAGTSYEWAPILTFRPAHIEPPASHQLQVRCSDPGAGFHGGFCLCKLCFCVFACLSNLGDSGFSLWPHSSEVSRGIADFSVFSAFYFAQMDWWLLSSYTLDWESEVPQIIYFHSENLRRLVLLFKDKDKDVLTLAKHLEDRGARVWVQATWPWDDSKGDSLYQNTMLIS